MRLYAVQNAFTAAHYRQRRIADIESAVIKVLVEAVTSMPSLSVKQNSTLPYRAGQGRRRPAHERRPE
jgi:hypothetical protein